jgi:putative acetyltransferase
MNEMFRIRLSVPADAEGILRAHYSAVHETASQDYSQQVLNDWSPPVDALRVAAHRAKMESDRSIISFVAVEASGSILGFGELVPPETLGAIYVAARAARRGVASALFRSIEAKARELGMQVMRMESSLTAVPFYLKHGFHERDRGTHRLARGTIMACVNMEKRL